jgi:glycosyltransferase involved in cell wall biosynthesis
MPTPKFILVTPAHNERETLRATIESIAAQTLRPVRWVIVSDGSTDGTDEVIKRAASSHEFIHYIRRERDQHRSFASKVFAIRAGLDALRDLEYDFVGFLDADITLSREFCETVCLRMQAQPRQGLGGGAVYERRRSDWRLVRSSYSMGVSGMMQMFRKDCYEQIGGYLPLPLGGIDMMAEAMARMRGWQVMSFMDVRVYHHHKMGRTHGKWHRALFRRGMMEYINGYHPVFQLARCCSWALCERPLFAASLLRTAGYFWAMIRQEPLGVPRAVVDYLRAEQMSRLTAPLRRRPFRNS